jgi:hypothetical protein
MALSFIGGQAHARDLTPGQRHHLVRYQGLEHVDWSVRENQLTIRAAFNHFGMSDGIAQCVANRESGFNNDAVNMEGSGASGLFQILRRYWGGRVNAYNRTASPAFKVKHDVFNARANSLVAAWMVRHGGWGPWGGGC